MHRQQMLLGHLARTPGPQIRRGPTNHDGPVGYQPHRSDYLTQEFDGSRGWYQCPSYRTHGRDTTTVESATEYATWFGYERMVEAGEWIGELAPLWPLQRPCEARDSHVR